MREASERRNAFRESEDGVNAARQSADTLFHMLLELAGEQRPASGYVVRHERAYLGGFNERLSLYTAGCTMLVDLYIPFNDSIQGRENGTDFFDDAHVQVRLAKGIMSRDIFHFPGEEPKVEYETKYEFDVDGLGGEGWRTIKDASLIDPEVLAVRLFTEFIDFAEANRTRR